MRGNLSFRLGAILLIGFVLLQVLLVIALQLPGRVDDRGYYGLPSPQALAALIRSVEMAGPRDGRRLVDNFDGSLFSVELRLTPPANFREVPPTMEPLATAYRRALPAHKVVVDGGPGRFNRLLGDRARPMRFLVPIRLTVWLRGGEVLVLTGRPANGLRAYLTQRSIIGLLGGASLLIVLWFALRQTTKPLQRLTHAVQALGGNLAAHDARLEGSAEVRTLAEAFNDMKHRISALVEERTFILAGIAHDMRTYLTRLQLRVDFIADEGQRTRAIRDLEQMSMLLDDSLLFASLGQKGVSETEPVDLCELTRELSALRHDRPRIQLNMPTTCFVLADCAGLERIFGNLVDNGMRYGNNVTIRIARWQGKATWTFCDDGPGVASADLRHLGTAYARLDPSRDRNTGGAGLGLAIVGALAGAMGSTVFFRSEPGRGLEVEVILAAVNASA